MLLQLENTNNENLKKLLDYAGSLHLNLKVLTHDNVALPGKPLTSIELKSLIENSRKSGAISMESAHDIIRKNFNED